MSFSAKIQKVRAIILDVDGVMTNGQIGFSAAGTIKFFNVRDGHAIKMALREGLLVGIISGRDDATTRARGEELNMSFVYTGQKVKLEAFAKVLEAFNMKPEQCLFMGDDLVDLPVMRQCGVAVCVADAEPAIVPFADWQTELGGGQGAVRELLFRVLKEKGLWDKAMARYIGD